MIPSAGHYRRVATSGAVLLEQKFFAAEGDCFWVADLRQFERFLLSGELFKIEDAIRQGREVVRALNGVVAG